MDHEQDSEDKKWGNRAKNILGAGYEKTKRGVEQIKGLNLEKSLLDTMKNSALALAKTAAEIDTKLREENSPYEVAFYRVSGNLTVVGGITFDVHFTKSAIAKQDSEFLTLINPRTQNQVRVPRRALVGRDIAKVRDPETGEILNIDAKKGIIVS